MRILILNADYPRFLAWLYRREQNLENRSYAAQMAARNASQFSLADFYSRNFAAAGHTAAEIHVNNPWLQSAWAREHGITVEPVDTPGGVASRSLPGWLQRIVVPFKPLLRPLARKLGLSPKLDVQAEKILLAQVEDFRPDLIINQDIFYVDCALASRLKQIGKSVLLGQVGIEPSRGEDYCVYDLMISQLLATVNYFRRVGVRAEVAHLAFEPTILESLPSSTPPDIDVSFVGTISADHIQRIALLEAIARRYDLKLYGNSLHMLPPSSPLHRCHQGEVWGTDMYNVLQRSRITLNSHIDMAGNEAGNVRLFEATGVGTFLLTDHKENLHTLFEPNREVAVWRSIDDCLTKIAYYSADETTRKEIAHAGQSRTLARHNYRGRTRDIIAMVEKL